MNKNIDLNAVLPGTLSKITSKCSTFYHLTWKVDYKTVTRYIRLDEIEKVERGIKAYQKAKKEIDIAAQKNLKSLIQARSK